MNSKLNLTLWPPNYVLKRSSRARHVRLRASIQRGLEVVLPLHFNHKYLPALLDQNRVWIEKQLSQLLLKQETREVTALPTQLDLLAINSSWKLQYVASNTKLQMMARPGRELVILGGIQEKTACLQLLRSWVREQAELHLISQLEIMSAKTGLVFKRASIRGQNRRWGSCSGQKSISLNYKLLFFPPELMSHILIHELCHTVHMNHSIQFWKLVERYDPQWKAHRHALRKAEQFIPPFI